MATYTVHKWSKQKGVFVVDSQHSNEGLAIKRGMTINSRNRCSIMIKRDKQFCNQIETHKLLFDLSEGKTCWRNWEFVGKKYLTTKQRRARMGV